MQPAAHSNDIHTILGRFHTWSGKQRKPRPAAAADLGEGVREVPYDEVLRRVQGRNASNPIAHPISTSVPNVPAAEAASLPAPASAPASTSTRPKAPSASPAAKTKRPSPTPRKSAPSVKCAKPAAPPPRRAAPRESREPEFRKVLAATVRKAPRAPAQAKDRRQRVSVRLSTEEGHRLHDSATKAGITVSEYLRRCALGANLAPRVPPAAAQQASAPPETAARAKTPMGEWIALLRNRFLASPVRFAERA